MIDGLKPYPEYTASGVPWLGQTPSHWKILKLKQLVGEINDRSESGREEMLSVSHITGVTRRSERNVNMFLSESNEGYKRCQPGDIAVNTLWAWMGALGVSSLSGIVSPAYAVYRQKSRHQLQSKYIDRLLRTPALVAEYLRRSRGIQESRLRLYPDSFLTIAIAVPPCDEQSSIVRYLGHADRLIGRCIGLKLSAISLLNEQRFAVIHAAVTGGLSPNGSKVASGVSWIGSVPRHWHVTRIKDVARLESGHTPSRQRPEYWAQGECVIPWFSLRDVKQLRDGKREYLGETTERISAIGLQNSSARVLPSGTVILSRTASVGFSGIMPYPMATTQDFANWICGPRLLPEYLLYAFRSMKTEFDEIAMGSTHQTIYMPQIARMTCPLPPMDEQREIVAYVRKEVARLDPLLDGARRQIALLREYRTRLIADVVTGRLDVREAAIRLPAEPVDAPIPDLLDDVDTDDPDAPNEDADA